MVVYLAADRPLREIKWEESTPRFHASALAPREESVQRQFGLPYVICVGAHTGCACGFQLGQYPQVWNPADAAEMRKSLRELANYVREAMTTAQTIQLFACWDGDQEASPEHRRTLMPSLLESDTFFFLEKELSAVTPDIELHAPVEPSP
jgi:hypothetical protein